MSFQQNLGEDMSAHRQCSRQRNCANGDTNDEAKPLEVTEIISIFPKFSDPDRSTQCRGRDVRGNATVSITGYPNRLVPNPIVSLIFDQHACRVHAARGPEHAARVAQMLDDGMRRQPEFAGDLLGFEVAINQAQAFALPMIQTR